MDDQVLQHWEDRTGQIVFRGFLLLFRKNILTKESKEDRTQFFGGGRVRWSTTEQTITVWDEQWILRVDLGSAQHAYSILLSGEILC